MVQTIYIQNQKYHLYDTYQTREEAYKIAKHKQKRTKTKYFIIKVEVGWLFPETKYRLYLNKVLKLTWK